MRPIPAFAALAAPPVFAETAGRVRPVPGAVPIESIAAEMDANGDRAIDAAETAASGDADGSGALLRGGFDDSVVVRIAPTERR